MAGAASGARPGAWTQGWWRGARIIESPNHGPRPDGLPIELVVLHSISLPPGQFGGDAVEQLFTNRLDPSAHPSFEPLRGLAVSAHFFVRRDGEVLQFVSCDRRAWHAGVSCWQGRDNCNDWSIGIELEGLEGDVFEQPQYLALATLMRALRRRYPITLVAGHEHVAPVRKRDPGPGFDWSLLQRLLRWRLTIFPASLPGGGGAP
ncbi:1,6-anhydro-N-acetylmuramyl-L-alanine amidase AmpD [Ideonella sp. A 288]|uniref:1,6-anhydro-N-acetylmuramyl-L-alanine amidase AmpD n=1 Tax=Ideonella sp. A 288 TaxID=1962181 RepID=UPI000B4BF523|nr:1,6-anhydro-N-acetylmuramyl-L-alanine amidase AmpD [Ideonella sp. A 288]